MLPLKTLYQYSFYFVFTFSFLIGGTFQFLFGFSNTVLTVFLGLIMFLNYLIYVYVKRKVLMDWVLISFLTYALIIILSSLVNKSNLVTTFLYLNFAFLPLSVYYFFHINKKEAYVKPQAYYKFIIFIACIQLPILIIQRNFYETLMLLNNSGQYIASYDFMYGTFLVKSDHSLGSFLLFIVIGLLFNINKINRYIKYRLVLSVYLSITLLFSESNISKALLAATWAVYIIFLLYHRIPKSFFSRKFYVIVTSIIFLLLVYNLRNIEFITSRLGGTIENNYTIEKSIYFFEEGTAKRLQIIIVSVYDLPARYLGDGPYSYFDILTGKFKNTIHFSQFIWSYFDLGLLGLTALLLYVYNLIRAVLKNNKHLFLFIFPIVLIYMMYTTPFSELGILISFFIIFSIKQSNAFNNNSISRLEKK